MSSSDGTFKMISLAAAVVAMTEVFSEPAAHYRHAQKAAPHTPPPNPKAERRKMLLVRAMRERKQRRREQGTRP